MQSLPSVAEITFMILHHEVGPCQLEPRDVNPTMNNAALMLIYPNLSSVTPSFSFVSACASKSRNNSIYKPFPQLSQSIL